MSSPMLSLRSPSRGMAYIMADHHLRDKVLLGLALYTGSAKQLLLLITYEQLTQILEMFDVVKTVLAVAT